MTERTQRRKVARAGFSQVAHTICLRLAEGQTLRAICAKPQLPSARTVYKWLAQGVEEPDGKYGEFSRAFALAREFGADALLEEMQELADNAGGAADLQRAKLRIDVLKWRFARATSKRQQTKGAAADSQSTHEEALAELERALASAPR